MNTFLEDIASEICSKHSDSLQTVQIVLPSKRGALFLKNAFKKQLGISFFMPQITTINEFVSEHTNHLIIDSSRLLLESYIVYKTQQKDKAESFDSYAKWAPNLLADIAEVDRYLIDPKAIFSDLRNIKEIEHWSFNEPTLSGSQKNYLEFWNTILPFYNALHKHLENKQFITSGLAYRKMAENIEKIQNDVKFKTSYFVGFNALSKSEESIIKALKNLGKAEIIFDIDKYYLNIKNHEAGYFYKKHKNTFNLSYEWEKEQIASEEKNIEIIASPNDILQAKSVAQLIENNPELISKKSALVLSDESLLLPILQELPELVDASNITMGYPAKLSLMYHMYMLLYKMHENSERYSSKETHRFHHKDFIDFIQHPIFSTLFTEVALVKQYLIKRNITFVNLNEIVKDLSEIKEDRDLGKELEAFSELQSKYSFLFNRWSNQSTAPLKCFIGFTDILREKFNQKIFPLEFEVLFTIWKTLGKMQKLFSDFSFLNEANYFKTLFNSIINNEKIDLIGEPLEGLQIIGMLETRTIDYENLIVTSVNEGIVPNSRSEQSIIPFDLKNFYGLPTYKEKDAIYAYYFYRLLHKSKNIWFLYNSETDGMSSGEYSRFLLQLKHEYPFKNSIVTKSIAQTSELPERKEIEVLKDDFYFKKLDYILSEKGISPSAINTWLTCPKDFYFKYILELRETNELEEEVGDNIFGTVIHNTLEDLYKPFVDKALKVEDVNLFIKNYEPILIKHFKKEYSKFYKTGKNLISFEMSKKIILAFLKNEVNFLKQDDSPLFIKSTEQDISCSTVLHVNGADKTVKFKGIADRVDQHKGVYRIIDYKTGKVESKDVNLKSIDKIETTPKAMQLMLYAYMFFKQKETISEVSSHIFALRNVKQSNFPLAINKEIIISKSQMKEVEEVLGNVINDMYSSTSIEHIDKSKYCIYCQ